MIKVCIFDLDGTLADTVESLAYCGNRALEAMGLSAFPTDRFRYFAGDGSAELVRRCLREMVTCNAKVLMSLAVCTVLILQRIVCIM